MTKLVYCITRKADVSPEEFYRYWLEDHGPKVRSVAKAIGAVKYVQSHTAFPERNEQLQASRGLEPPYDGITEVWFDENATLPSADEQREASRMLLEDESTFIDFARSRVFMTQEHVIFDYTAESAEAGAPR